MKSTRNFITYGVAETAVLPIDIEGLVLLIARGGFPAGHAVSAVRCFGTRRPGLKQME